MNSITLRAALHVRGSIITLLQTFVNGCGPCLQAVVYFGRNNMPELPELEVVKEVLERRVVGQRIIAVHVIASGALVVRDLTGTGLEEALTGTRIDTVARRG